MPNFEQSNPIKEHPNPQHREELLKGATFKFSEEERKEKIKSGISSEEIETQEREVIERQKLSSEEKKENEKNVIKPEEKRKKPSFEKFKIQQEIEFYENLKAARQRKDAAYKEQEKKAA